MDWLTFSVELVKALIWPLMVVIILIIIRKPLSQLVPYLKKLKLGELEAEFEKTVKQIKDSMDLEPVLNNKKKAAVIPPAEAERLYQLSEIAPNAAVLEAWDCAGGVLVAPLNGAPAHAALVHQAVVIEMLVEILLNPILDCKNLIVVVVFAQLNHAVRRLGRGADTAPPAALPCEQVGKAGIKEGLCEKWQGYYACFVIHNL